MVHNNSELSLVVEVKSKHYIEKLLIALKESVLSQLIESFSLGGMVFLGTKEDCVFPKIDGLRNRILEEAHGSRYSIHPGSTKMYHELREIFWWEGLKVDIAEFVARCLN